MYWESGTVTHTSANDVTRVRRASGQSADTVVCDAMTVILKVWRKNQLRQSMHIYVKKNPVKFHPD